MIEMTRRAAAVVVNFPHTCGTTLLDNLGGEIDFVMRGPNARAELRNEVGCLHPEAFVQQFDCVCGNSQCASFFARVDQTDSAEVAINEIKGAAIGDVDAETNIALVGNQSIAISEATIVGERRIDDGDFVSMHLLRRNKRTLLQAKFAPRAPMNFVETIEHNGFVVRQFDAGNAPNKPVGYLELSERGKSLERKKVTFQLIGRVFDEWCSLLRNRRLAATALAWARA